MQWLPQANLGKASFHMTASFHPTTGKASIWRLCGCINLLIILGIQRKNRDI